MAADVHVRLSMASGAESAAVRAWLDECARIINRALHGSAEAANRRVAAVARDD